MTMWPARTSAELKKLGMVLGELNILSCLAETSDPSFSSLLNRVLWRGKEGILSPSINFIDNIMRVLDNPVSITGKRISALYLIPPIFGLDPKLLISFSSMLQFFFSWKKKKKKDSANYIPIFRVNQIPKVIWIYVLVWLILLNMQSVKHHTNVINVSTKKTKLTLKSFIRWKEKIFLLYLQSFFDVRLAGVS